MLHRAWYRLFVVMLISLSLGAGCLHMRTAKGHFRHGQKQYDKGDYQSALRSFSFAYQKDPQPAFLFNIGQCHFELQYYAKAAKYFKKYLKENPRASNKKAIRKLIKEAEQRSKRKRRS